MENNFKERITIVSIILGIAVALLNIAEKSKVIQLDFDSVLLTELLNVFILAFFYFHLKPKKLLLNNDLEIAELAHTLNIEDKNFNTLRNNNVRVNKLVFQLCKMIRLFIVILFFFYLVNCLKDFNVEVYDWFNGESPDSFPWMDFLDIATNSVSASFLYLGFIVLYESTLDGDNEPRDYYTNTVLFLVILLGTYFFITNSLVGHQGYEDSLNRVSLTYKLISGFYNGLAMVLLFGRITAMEYFFKEGNHKVTTSPISININSFTILFALPLYVLAQPMYPILEIPQLTENSTQFKSLVFIVCFLGKGTFLLWVSNNINSKRLHAYLHLVLAKREIPSSIVSSINHSSNSVTNTDGSAISQNGNMLNTYLLDTEGEYEYVCTERDSSHSHGGTCKLSALNNFQNVIEWKIQGMRKWSKNNKDIINYEPPFLWETQKGIFLTDRSYFYSYFISVDGQNLFGISKGHIALSADNKTIEGMNGTYYQQSGNTIIWGVEKFSRLHKVS